MALKKTVAIILRTMKMGETSLLLTLYSREVAVLKLVAKGARSSKSRYSGILQPLNTVEVVYYEKANRDLHTLSQATVLDSPDMKTMGPDSIVLAMACCEMATRLEAYSAVSTTVFDHLSVVISVFARAGERSARTAFLVFQVKLLQTLGYSPELERCSRCGSESAQHWFFDFHHVRLFCHQCGSEHYRMDSFQPETIRSLLYFLSGELRSAAEMSVKSLTLAEIYRFVDRFYNYHLPEMQNLKSLKVLRQMKLFNPGDSLASSTNN